MEYTMFNRFAATLASVDLDQRPLDSRLLISQDGALSAWYAPFDFVNTNARIVIVGITPGLQQAGNAIRRARDLLISGASAQHVLAEAKGFASFSGGMRSNLIAMLDNLGVADKLQIDTCSHLFGNKSSLVHYTSVLRYPVLIQNNNYSGAPDPLSVPFLRQQIATYLAEEARLLPDAIWIPLGPKVSAVMDWVASQGLVNRDRVLSGLQHPSSANMERISYLLGRKPRDKLSIRTNADKIDAEKAVFLERLAKLSF